MVGPNWPNGGEIDIIEGVNTNNADQVRVCAVLQCARVCAVVCVRCALTFSRELDDAAHQPGLRHERRGPQRLHR